mgnify:CR=1 FL=1
MSRYEDYMKSKMKEEELRINSPNKKKDLKKKADGLLKDLYEKTGLDMVNNPPHYNQHGIECVDAIQAATNDGFHHYLQGNIIKYIWRYKYKNGKQDLQKAAWYLEKLIEIYDES